MSVIKVLPQHLVNKIAAGEVVERPMSVVKELLENSLDAGAGRVTIDIEDGGKKLIRIADDGRGMTAEEIALAFTPHATSKIANEDDLAAIHTLGFRGEALASIASISQVEVISRPADQIEGARLVIQGGDFEPVTPAPASVGTTMSIRNLFYNTPARRKFLRTSNTEMGHITEQFIRIALAYPHAHLTLNHNGRTLHDLPADQSLRQRIADLFTAELAQDLIPIQRSDHGVEVSGLIAPPQQSRAAKQLQYVFLNGRFIRDKFIGHAIREGYRGMMEINRQPVVFIFLKLDPAEVDVNVHPTKIEVRFVNSNSVHSQVLAAIRDRLLGSDLSVPLRTKPDADDTAQAAPSLDDNLRDDEQHRQRVRQAMVDFFKTNAPGSSGSAPAQHSTRPAGQLPQQRLIPDTERFCADSPAPAPPEVRPLAADDANERLSPSSQPSARPPVRFIQIHNSYLAVESPEGMIIVDQHALHERVIYEQLYAQHNSGPLPSQRALIPETIDVSPSQMAAMEEYRETLEELGVFVEQFGPRTIAIQGFPALLNKACPRTFIADLLDILVEQAGRVSREQLIHHLLDMMACKAAVKAGDHLNDDEIQALLAQREKVERAGNCPHGPSHNHKPEPGRIRQTIQTHLSLININPKGAKTICECLEITHIADMSRYYGRSTTTQGFRVQAFELGQLIPAELSFHDKMGFGIFFRKNRAVRPQKIMDFAVRETAGHPQMNIFPGQTVQHRLN